MRVALILLIALPIVAAAAPEQTNKPWPGGASRCDVMNCSHDALPFDPPAPASATIPIHDATTPDGGVVSPVIAKGGGRGGRGVVVGGGGGGGHKSSAYSKSASNPFAVLRGPLLLLNSIIETTKARVSLGGEAIQARDTGVVAVDNPAEAGVENEDHMLPITRRSGCDAILGFDCGSASRADAGPVGKLARWMHVV